MKTLIKLEDWIEDKPLLDNTYWFLWRWYQRLIVDSYCTVKYSIQKLIRGYADYEVWNLDTNISHYIYPRLKAFIKLRNGCPNELTFTKWKAILNKILFAIEEDVNRRKNQPSIENKKEFSKYWDRINKGHELLGKWYGHLWD